MQSVGLWRGPLPLEPWTLPESNAVERRIRQGQMWQLQRTLQDMVFCFQDWLCCAEAAASSPESSQVVPFALCKQELQRFQALQRQVSAKLLPLEALNRQYRRLVRTGSVCPELKSRVQDVNRRWDALQAWSSAVSKRLKHFVNQREEFESERETLRLWLMELDLRLTDVEHFSGGTSLEKMIQLQAFQEDVQANAERVDRLLVRGERLIQKSHPEDAETLEEELQELSCFCQEVFRRVFRFRRQLVSMRLVFEDEWLSDRDSDFSEGSLPSDKAEAGRPTGPVCQSTPRKALLPPKGAASAHEAGMMDLEWDPSVDVGGGSTSHDEEDSSYFSAIAGAGLWEEPRRRSRASRWVSGSLPLRSDSREDFAEQNAFGEERDRLDDSVAKQRRKTCSFGKPLPGGAFAGRRQPPKRTSEKENGFRLVEPVGFDPKRIESWLGQNCREERGMPAVEAQQQISGEEALGSRPAAEIAITVEKGCSPLSAGPSPDLFAVQSPKTLSTRNPARMLFLFLFLLAALLLLFLSFFSGPPSLSFSKASCLQENNFAKSFHLMLKYSGPPPT